MNSLNKIVLLSVLLLCTAPAFSMDIFSAVEAGAVDMVQELIGKDQHVVNQQDAIGDTPLLRAARIGHTEIVNMLLKARADLNKQANDGSTPLHEAAYNGHTEIVRMLLDAGAHALRRRC